MKANRMGVLLLLGLVACPEVGLAQGVAATLDELRLLVRSGDTLTLTDASGTKVTGRLDSLSPTVLTLMVDGARRQWQAEELRSISQRYRDSLGNGALIGLGVGGGLAAVGLVIATNSDVGLEASAGEAMVAVAFYAGLGAGIGTGVDALIPGQRLVFERPGPGGPSLALKPLLGRHRVGAALSIGF